jgi:hypothetical protein
MTSWRDRDVEWWAKAGIIMQLVILIRSIAEFYRLRHYFGSIEALARYQPYLGGLLIDAALCLLAAILLFWNKPRAAAVTCAATIFVLLAYKVVAIG